jgi:hypothetical protein
VSNYLITARPNQVLIGFRNLLNRLWEIDRTDHKNRLLAWVLDLGRQEFDDESRFWNVQQVLSRFKALKSFEEFDARTRWNWLRSRAVIVLYDPRGDIHGGAEPAFTAGDILFSEIPRSWDGLQQIRTLYGPNLDRVNETNFTIFLRRSVEDPSKSVSFHKDHQYELRYFGHASFGSPNNPSGRHARGLELPPLPENYADAFCTVCAGALEFLRHANDESVVERGAMGKLRRLRFRFLDLEKFIEEF